MIVAEMSNSEIKVLKLQARALQRRKNTTIKYTTEYKLYRSNKNKTKKKKTVTLNNMIVMLPFSRSSYEKHSQWSDNGHNDDVCVPPPSLSFSNNRVSFVFFLLKKSSSC